MIATKFFAALAIFVTVVVAQGDNTTAPDAGTPTGGPTVADIPACVLGCVQPAAAAVNCSFADAACVCTNTEFQAASNACLAANCTDAEVTAAVALQTSVCSTLAGGNATDNGNTTTGSNSTANGNNTTGGNATNSTGGTNGNNSNGNDGSGASPIGIAAFSPATLLAFGVTVLGFSGMML